MTDPHAACPRCGASFPSGGRPAGPCPHCLLEFAFGETGAAAEEASSSSAAGSSGAAPDPPSRASVPAEDFRPGASFGPYRIESLLGRGGMGVVYRALQPALGRTVALKVLPSALARDPQFTERFQREARSLAGLSHPHIVGVHDFGCIDGRYYFTMEFVDGVSLRELLRAGRLAPARALEVVPQLCDALQSAHSQGLVHRDIKPENILIDNQGRVKVADFGLAKLVGRDSAGTRGITGTNAVMGTAHYMAPEQVESPREVDHRADIYSLGVVFYEMLTGELPLGRFEPPSRKVEVSVRLDEVVLKALEKSPERRYQQASDVKEDASRYGSLPATPAGQPVRDNVTLAWLSLFFAAAVCVELVRDLGERHPDRSDARLLIVLGCGVGAMVFGTMASRGGRRRTGRAAVVSAGIVLLVALGAWSWGTVEYGEEGDRPLLPARAPAEAEFSEETRRGLANTEQEIRRLRKALLPDDPGLAAVVREYDRLDGILASLEGRTPVPWSAGLGAPGDGR